MRVPSPPLRRMAAHGIPDAVRAWETADAACSHGGYYTSLRIAFASSPSMHCLVVLDFKLVLLPFAHYLSTSFSDLHNAKIDVIE